MHNPKQSTLHKKQSADSVSYIINSLYLLYNQLMKHTGFSDNISPHSGHKNSPYTPVSLQMYSGYMALVLWILNISVIKRIIAFIAYSFNSSDHPVTRNRHHHTRTRPQKGRQECILIYLASTGRERQALMTAKRKISGQDYGFTHEHIYRKQYSGKAIDVLQEVNKKGMHIVEGIANFRLSKEGHINIKGDCGDIEVKLFNHDRVNLNVHSRKLLDMLLMKLSEQLPYGEEDIKKATLEVLRITVTLKEFMELCGLSDKKNARDHFRAAAECMFSIYMTFDYEVFQNTGKRRKRVKKHFSAYLLEATVETRNLDSDPIVNSEISFRFGPSLMEYLCTRYIMPIDINIFKINPHKNPHAYNIARHLSEVYRVRMNKGQHPLISVETLLEACPELPTVDEMKAKHHKDRHFEQLIMEPVERDLDAIRNIYGLVDWHYTHSNGVPLSDEELGYSEEYGLTDDKEYPYSFNEWLHFMIDFTLPDYPYTTERGKKHLAGKRKHAAAKKN